MKKRLTLATQLICEDHGWKPTITSNKNILTKNARDLGLVYVSKKYGNKIVKSKQDLK